MICQECNKKQATVHITKILNGKKIEMHLCDECAEHYQQEWSEMIDSNFSINEFLANLLNYDLDFNKSINNNILKCSRCGQTYTDFTQTGRIGCPECYETFGKKLLPLLRRFHGSKRHKGKIPKRTGGDIELHRKLEDLKYILKELVKKEEFEEAAKIRDEIKEVENRIKLS